MAGRGAAPADRRSSFGRLLAEAARHPMLGRDEELHLAVRAEQGDHEAMRRLVGSHLRFVIHIARSYRGWGVPMADLVQEGILAFIQAVRRFDPKRDVRLSTYAAWSIRAAMQDYALRSWSMVRLGTSNAQRMLALKLRHLVDGWGGDGSDDDRLAALAEQFGTTMTEVVRLARRMAGRDSPIETNETGGGSGLIDRLIGDWPSPEQRLARLSEHRLRRDALKVAFAGLSPRERLIICKRYCGEGRCTFEAIGRELGVSKDRVRQLEARALAKLRELLQPREQSWAGS